jgi:hypothetical protein
MQASAHDFIIFIVFMVLCAMAATSLALAVAAWARTTNMAVVILPMVSATSTVQERQLCLTLLCYTSHAKFWPNNCLQALEICRLFGGYYLSPANLPGGYEALLTQPLHRLGSAADQCMLNPWDANLHASIIAILQYNQLGPHTSSLLLLCYDMLHCM